MARRDNLTILYPPGCREVTEDLSPDELIRRLKTLAHTLQSMGQDDGAYQEYIPLAMHIADEFYLSYNSKDVQLLIACCIADVLRVYAPEAPYKDPKQIKNLFMFLIKQLGGLKDPKDPAFKRYFYLLENLAYVKSFNMCFELEDSQEIFCKLFKLMFHIVNDEHSSKVKSFMLDVLCPLINESDVVSNELLDCILCNILDPAKTQRKNACQLAKDLIVKCADTLEPYIQNFFNHVLILGREEKKLSISPKVYDLIYELNHICPSILLSVLPQLEFKLKSSDEEERYSSVSLLARMFSEKDSTLAVNHKQLWEAFLGRFNDISTKIRTKCVQYSMHFLINHPVLRKDITDTLKMRQHDAEETVRYEVVMAIVTTAKRDFSIVAESDDLLTFVKERTLDKKFKIRKEAMCGLAMIYKKHMNNNDLPPDARHITWIRDKILHGYYMTSIDDRLLVERLVNTCLVPYQLSSEERMNKLLQMFASIDDNATKAFNELQRHQMAVRKSVSELIELQKKGNPEEKELASKLSAIARFLPDPLKVQEFIRKLWLNIGTDSELMALLETVLNPNLSCKDSVEAVTQILKKLGQPVMTNLYYNTIKMLMERVSNVMIDHSAMLALTQMVQRSVDDDQEISDTICVPNDILHEKGLKLLLSLSLYFPAHFLHQDILPILISLLESHDLSVAPVVLSILTNIGKSKPIYEIYPDIVTELITKCHRFAVTGDVKQAKHAVRCLHTNLNPTDQQETFSKIIERIREQLTLESPHFRSSIVSLGHIVFCIPDKFLVVAKNTVSRKIVKELLMRNQTTNDHRSEDEEWTEEENVGEETLVKIEGLKMMARWLLGLKDDILSAQKTFRMLNAFILHKGDLLECNTVPKYEMSRLRLSAGASMLKICEQKGVGDQFITEQFINLSRLMCDSCTEVRLRFSQKLHKGLSRGIPHKCLPLDFMGFYAMAGLETDKQVKNAIKQSMTADIIKRREYIKSITMSGGERAYNQLPRIMPDYMLVFAVPVLTHHPLFTDVNDVTQLNQMRQCLWFILEPLITKNDSYCFGFYKALIEQMKNHKDALKPEDEATNHKMWAVCDLAMGLILSKTVSFEMKEFPSEPRIPPLYFKKHENPDFVNANVYLPSELQVTAPKKSTKNLPGVSKKTTVTKTTDSSQSVDIDLPDRSSEVSRSSPDSGTSSFTAVARKRTAEAVVPSNGTKRAKTLPSSSDGLNGRS